VKKYDPTVEYVFSQTMQLDDQQYTLDILDTAGTSDFHSIRDIYINQGQGFIFVYSIINQLTLNGLTNFIYDHIKRIKGEHVPMVLVGNKCDLEDERKVTTEEGNELARQYGANFFEASAKENVNVENIFIDVCKQIVRTLPTKTKTEGCQLM